MRTPIARARPTTRDTGLPRGGAECGALLTSPAFVLAVALLVVNDWVLKAALGNWLTGKLSDFAGLYAFALFWTALLPARRDAAFLLTALGFMAWKSPASAAPLAAWNALGVWPVARVVDYTDWVALAALVPAYRLARRHAARAPLRRSHLARRLGVVATASAAVAAFAATSVAPPSYDLHDPTSYLISATRGEVREGLESLSARAAGMSAGSRAVRERGRADTLVVYIRQPPERVVGVTVEVLEVAPSELRIRLLRASAPGPEPRVESVQRAFRAQVFEPLREWVARRRAAGS